MYSRHMYNEMRIVEGVEGVELEVVSYTDDGEKYRYCVNEIYLKDTGDGVARRSGVTYVEVFDTLPEAVGRYAVLVDEAVEKYM